jgi:hypothetical protein
MSTLSMNRWAAVGLFNLLLVALYGLVMRYKIAFAFPYLDQRNLLHAHSHFAFAGWVSLLLMALMVQAVTKEISAGAKRQFSRVLWAFLICSWGMLIAFTLQGYGAVSIFFATASVLVSFIYCHLYYKYTKQVRGLQAKPWFYAALVFNIISTFGTFYLSYMMASKSIVQHHYLATIYWYLHFQYNGWFLFACIGLFVYYLQTKDILLRQQNTIFRLLAFSCIPAYGLSILWLQLPLWVLFIIGAAALTQFAGALQLLYLGFNKQYYRSLQLSTMGRILFLFCSAALLIKTGLQSGSTIPWVSKLAFGFRPIVIAYLHLVLLAFVTVFILAYLYTNKFISHSKTLVAGMVVLLSGIFLNEVILGVQGIAAFGYTYIPYINESLVVAAIVLFLGTILLNIGNRKYGRL